MMRGSIDPGEASRAAGTARRDALRHGMRRAPRVGEVEQLEADLATGWPG